jgi:hypothetical protein
MHLLRISVVLKDSIFVVHEEISFVAGSCALPFIFSVFEGVASTKTKRRLLATGSFEFASKTSGICCDQVSTFNNGRTTSYGVHFVEQLSDDSCSERIFKLVAFAISSGIVISQSVNYMISTTFIRRRKQRGCPILCGFARILKMILYNIQQRRSFAICVFEDHSNFVCVRPPREKIVVCVVAIWTFIVQTGLRYQPT